MTPRRRRCAFVSPAARLALALQLRRTNPGMARPGRPVRDAGSGSPATSRRQRTETRTETEQARCGVTIGHSPTSGLLGGRRIGDLNP
jgi:hypothetical protein